MCFTIWYGVLAPQKGELVYACGGHPPAVLLATEDSRPQPLAAAGAIVGGFPETTYSTERVQLRPGSRLYLFSDGVYELRRSDDSTVSLEQFIAEFGKPMPASRLNNIMNW